MGGRLTSLRYRPIIKKLQITNTGCRLQKWPLANQSPWYVYSLKTVPITKGYTSIGLLHIRRFQDNEQLPIKLVRKHHNNPVCFVVAYKLQKIFLACMEAIIQLPDKGKPFRKGGTQSQQPKSFPKKDKVVRLPKAKLIFPSRDLRLWRAINPKGG